MNVWIDTEFNSYRGEFISIGLVDAEDRTFYHAVPCPHPDPWVAQHVLPLLGTTPITVGVLQTRLEAWLAPYPSVHLIADWPEDIAYFCNLLITGPGTRINTPRLTMEICRNLDGAVSKTPHHALEDAKAIKAEYLRLTP